MNHLIKSKIEIGGKEFPLKLSKEEVKKVKLIEGELATKIKTFQQNYGNISMQDCLTMICIEQAFTIQHNKDSQEAVDKVLDQVEEALTK